VLTIFAPIIIDWWAFYPIALYVKETSCTVHSVSLLT